MSDVIYNLQARHPRNSPVFVVGFPRSVLAGQEVLAYTTDRRGLKRFARAAPKAQSRSRRHVELPEPPYGSGANSNGQVKFRVSGSVDKVGTSKKGGVTVIGRDAKKSAT